MMQSSSLVHLQPPGQGPVGDLARQSSVVRGVMPSNTAWEMVMIFPTPAASMYTVEMDVLSGLALARPYHGRLK